MVLKFNVVSVTKYEFHMLNMNTWFVYMLQDNSETHDNGGVEKTSDFPFSNTSSPDEKDSDILPYPMLHKAKTKPKRKHFIITSDELIEHKVCGKRIYYFVIMHVVYLFVKQR